MIYQMPPPLCSSYTGARWCRGMLGALQLEGCGFESTSKPPRRDPGQVLHSQLLMRFGVKLRLSVRAVVGSASEWEICEGRNNKCSNTIQYNNVQLNIPFCAEMNAESNAILQVMICETKHEIQGGW